MPVLWFMEYDIPKDEDTNKKYMSYIFDEGYSCIVMEKCKQIDAKLNVWSDGFNHIIMTIEFERIQDYAKLFDESEWRKGLSKLSQLVLNVNTRLMRSAGE
jgi:hypothetical protein